MKLVFSSGSWLHFLLRISRRTLVAIFLFLLTYAMLAGIGTLWPANSGFIPSKEGTTVFVRTNGFHTDVILPVEKNREGCFSILSEATIGSRFGEYAYAAFGWGDRDFYLSSYESAFPSTTTVLDALLVPGETLMHVTFLRNTPQTDPEVKAVRLSGEQYEKLKTYISQSFRLHNQSVIRLNQPGYGDSDFFYEAEGKYHLFNTCNVWTGSALREAGVKISRWTPLESSVFYYLP